jgi:hypothetical protein
MIRNRQRTAEMAALGKEYSDVIRRQAAGKVERFA